MDMLVNRDNYLLVRKYLESLREDEHLAEASIARYRFYLRHALLWAMETPFSQAHAIKPSLPAYLESEAIEPLATETRKKVVENTRKFFEWCKMEQAQKFRSLPTHWVQKLKFQRKNAPDIQKEPEFLLPDEVVQLASLPGDETDLAHWRDRAMAARLFLTGERASAAVTSPISCIDFDKLSLKQWPELGVKTKNGKRATTFLFNVPELITIARSWDEYVRANLPPDAPWYASINNQWGEQTLTADAPGSNRNIALNKRLRLLFEQAGLPYRSAHKFRHGHAAYGLLHCQTMADYKALSLNLMHESLEVTDSIYVHLKLEELRNRITNLAIQPIGMPDSELEQFLLGVSRQNIPSAIKILVDRMSG
jgi:integrase